MPCRTNSTAFSIKQIFRANQFNLTLIPNPMKRKILLNTLYPRHLLYAWLMAPLLLVGLSSADVIAQTRVTGKVIDSSGESLPGVSILLKGTAIGVSTDADGQYAIELPDGGNHILVYSFIGYKTHEELVGSRTLVNITLETDNKMLDEVVVVGYGTQLKSDITGSIASVSSEALREVPAANLQQALQSRAAGLEIQRIGTTPGAGAQIRIRGERSISGSNDPLIVLDNIPYQGNISDINPDEIESVEVLKDASATAIYGSRGANGVILVTTKRGVKGPTRVNIDSYYGIAQVARKYDVYSPEEYRAMRDISPWNQGYMPEELESINTGRSTDWQDLMYQDGYITNHNLSASGGNEYNQFSVGGGYFKETTVLPGQDYQRGSLRSTMDFKVGEKLKMGFNSMNMLSITNGSQFGLNMFPILALSPLMPAYNTDGTVNRIPAGNIDDQLTTYSPLLLKENNNQWTDRVRRFRTFNSMYGEYEILDGLKYRLNVGLEYQFQEGNQFRGADSYFRPRQGNTARIANSEEWSYTLENLLTYEKTFGGKHRIGATALYSVQKDQFHSSFIQKDSINADFIQYYDLGQSNQSVTNLPTYGGNESSWGLESYMIRLNYAFDDKYLITLTGRRDGSSRLGGKYTNYPAISVGWNLTNENFMKSVPILSNAKLRVGWGETSNQSITPYATLGGVTNSIDGRPVRYNYGSQIVQGYYVGTAPNANLDWEYTRSLNIGLDFGILQDRITGSVEWYNAQTNNILYSQSLPSSSGIPGNFTTNIGEMENKGVEIQLSSTNVRADNGFTWSTDFNIFWNRNKLLKLNDGFERNIANGLHIGHPLTAIYDYKKLGIWQIDEADEAASFGQVPGQLKLADLSGPEGVPDGVINQFDQTVIGSSQAKFQGGLTNRFAFKGFDLSIVAYFRVGGLLNSAVHAPYGAYLTQLDGRRNQISVDYWTPTNPTNKFPMPSAQIAPPNAQNAWTTLGYYDASFVKIRSINLGYTFSDKILETLKIRSLRAYVTAQNPFLLFSPYRNEVGGVDPEPTGTGTSGFVQNGGNIPNRALTIAAATPPTRSFIFGLNIGL